MQKAMNFNVSIASIKDDVVNIMKNSSLNGKTGLL